VAGGAVGAVLRGVEVRPLVSQGARPIGRELTITAAEGNVIHELASQPALERLQQVIVELEPAERALAAEGVLLGIVVDPNKPDYDRGDFLIRPLIGADEQTGAITVGARVRLGQTVLLQVGDAESAHDDLMDVLGRQVAALGGPPAGALLFTCNGAVLTCSGARVTTPRRSPTPSRERHRRLLLRGRDRPRRRPQLRARLHRDAGRISGLSGARFAGSCMATGKSAPVEPRLHGAGRHQRRRRTSPPGLDPQERGAEDFRGGDRGDGSACGSHRS
jgi:FIST C domain/FIST N domain